MLWPALALLLLGGAGAVGLKVRRRRLVERTHEVLSINPRLEEGPTVRSVPGLAFAAPATSISARLDPGTARTWTA